MAFKKRIHRSLYKLNKRVFDRKFLRAFQNGMLQNMRNTCAVRRRRLKSDIKYFVFILIG